MKVLIIRPQPGADATAQRFRAAGHVPLVMPLFEIQPVAATSISASGYDAVVLTSGNAVRAAEPFLKSNAHVPVYAVGSATARAAEKSAIMPFRIGSSGIDALVDVAEQEGHTRLLWLAGEDHSPLQARPGVTVDTHIVYKSVAVPTPDDFAAAVAQSDLVILHSSRAAQHFAACCDDAGISRHEVALATFSDAIARNTGDGWSICIVAPTPNDAALLEAIQTHYKTTKADIIPRKHSEGTT